MRALFNSLVEKTRRLVAYYEDQSYSFWIGLIGVTVVVLARVYLESAVEEDQILGIHPVPKSSILAFFNHHYLFFIAVYTWMVVILHWVSGEKVARVARIVLAAFVVILIVPVIDFLVSRGAGYQLRYVLETEHLRSTYALWNWFQELYGISIGQRVEVLLGAIGAAVYPLLKRRGGLRAVEGFAGFYLLLTVLGVFPVFFTEVSRFLWKGQTGMAVFEGGLGSTNRNYGFILLLIIAVSGWILLKRVDLRLWNRITQVMRSRASLGLGAATLGGFVYGYFLYRTSYPFITSSLLNFLAVLGAVAAFSLTWVSVRLWKDSRKRRRPWVAFILWLTAFYLACNVGFVALLLQMGLTLVCMAWRFSRLRTVVTIVLVAGSFCGGFSLIAQNGTLTSLWPWETERRAARGHFLAGRDHFLRQNFALAIDQFQTALKMGYRDHQLHFRLAQSYQLTGFTDNALEELTTAMRMNPRDSEIYKVMGSILRARGEFREEKAVYEAGIHNTVEQATFLLEKARAEMGLEELRLAEHSLETALAFAAPRTRYYELMAKLAELKSDPREALRMYDKLLEYDSRSAQAHRGKGMIYHSLNEYPHARYHYQRSIELDRSNPYAHNNLGVVLLEMGHLDQADGEFRKALGLNPGLPMAHYNRGRIAEYLGMIEEAKEHYQRALEADSTYTPASDALEDLSGE